MNMGKATVASVWNEEIRREWTLDEAYSALAEIRDLEAKGSWEDPLWVRQINKAYPGEYGLSLDFICKIGKDRIIAAFDKALGKPQLVVAGPPTLATVEAFEKALEPKRYAIAHYEVSLGILDLKIVEARSERDALASYIVGLYDPEEDEESYLAVTQQVEKATTLEALKSLAWQDYELSIDIKAIP